MCATTRLFLLSPAHKYHCQISNFFQNLKTDKNCRKPGHGGALGEVWLCDSWVGFKPLSLTKTDSFFAIKLFSVKFSGLYSPSKYARFNTVVVIFELLERRRFFLKKIGKTNFIMRIRRIFCKRKVACNSSPSIS